MDKTLVEILTTIPIVLDQVDERTETLAKMPTEQAQAELAEARRLIRFDGRLVLWQYQQAILDEIEGLLRMSPGLRAVAGSRSGR